MPTIQQLLRGLQIDDGARDIPIRLLPVSFELRPTAKGEATQFDVTVHLTWTGVRVSEKKLRKLVAGYQPYIQADLRKALRLIARRHPPHRADRVESEVKQELGRIAALYDDRLSCSIDVQVEVDKTVRERLAVAMQRWIDLITHEEYGRQRAAAAEALTDLWRHKLDGIGNQLTVTHAAHLADEPDDFASTVAAVVDEGVARTANLEQILREAIEGHQRIGSYEFVTSYDTALAGFMKYMGVESEPSNGKASSNPS